MVLGFGGTKNELKVGYDAGGWREADGFGEGAAVWIENIVAKGGRFSV